MKALTVCQPYADLILLPDSHQWHKRTENRRWPTRYRGPLLIHAGKSRDWLEDDYDNPGYDIFGLKTSELVFGAIVGVVDQVACFSDEQIRQNRLDPQYFWLRMHRHVEGPYCHVMVNPRRFAQPIPYRGAQGYFDVPDSVVGRAALDFVLSA